MFGKLIVNQTEAKIRVLVSAALVGCIVWLALTFFRRPGPVAGHPALQADTTAVNTLPNESAHKLEGDSARSYLEQTNDGQSIMKMVDVQQYGLKRVDHSPFDRASGAGYLGMSHDENLNAWFGDEGATIRPTLSEKDKTWRLEMKLKAYGYGEQLQSALPPVGHNVKENRIEYERATAKPVRAGLVPARSDSSEEGQGQAKPLQNPPSAIVEWYENHAEGIEQGFTLNQKPARDDYKSSNEQLRLVVAVNGDLRARATNEGQAVELDRGDESILSYSHLIATDAKGKTLTARMETNEKGDEIALVMNDDDAQYPITVDPITATLTQKLDASNVFIQQDARFGFAVAIDGNRAVVGAWREDDFSNPFTPSVDAGAAYVFNRTSSGWSGPTRLTAATKNANDSCGWSVAIRDSWLMFGCPGADNNTGKAVYRNLQTGFSNQIDGTNTSVGVGARLGASIVIGASDGNFYWAAVGAPLADVFGAIDSGGLISMGLGQGGMSANWTSAPFTDSSSVGSQFGASLATDGTNLLVGEPNGFGLRCSIFTSAGPGAAQMDDFTFFS